jgi:hypothetical protein
MLRFKNADNSVRELRDAEAVWAELRQHVKGAFIHFIVHQKQDVLALLREWISASGGDDPTAWRIRRESGQQRHILQFSDHTNMARALMGEFLGRMALDDSENQLGAATVQSAYVRAHLRALVERLRMKLAHASTASTLKTLLDPATDCSRLEYQPLYRKRGAHLAKVLRDPDAYHFEDLVVTLHDLMSAIKKLSPGLVEVPPDQCMGTYFRINDLGEPEYSRRTIGGTRDFRYKAEDPQTEAHYTLIESSGFVMAARVQGMPIWAGPSFTTARMMKMAEWAGATAEEYEALAWGIFAFWNQCYPTSSTWVHRFHEVMDMAANWGVPFEAFAYPRSAPPGNRSLRPKL